MPTPSCCDRLIIRVVLLKVRPLVARLISVPHDLSLEELHDVLQLVLGWSGQAFYNFRIHGQEVGRRRHLRTHLLCEFQLRRREKFLYTYDFLDLGEWEIRVWISNREGQKHGDPVAWQAGPRRHRKNAAFRAGTCEFWISTSSEHLVGSNRRVHFPCITPETPKPISVGLF
jgi:Plasmid pRiA4b ORF-3-like protein